MKDMQYQGVIFLRICIILFNDSAPIFQKQKPTFHSRHIRETEKKLPWCFPVEYDNEVEPWKYRHLINFDLPWYYNFEYDISDIQEVNDKEQTITLDMYWSIYWREPRLKIDLNTSHWRNESRLIKGAVSINIPMTDLEQFWIPDSEIYGVKSFTSEVVLKPAASFRLTSEKVLRYIARAHIIISCQMNFKDYPFDTQECLFRQGSFYNPIDIVDCTSKTTHRFNMQRDLQYRIHVLELPSKYHTVVFDQMGNWSTCGFKIVLERKKTQTFFQVYFTSTLLVFASFVSFIVNPDVVPGRMGLLVTVLLVLINIFISVKSNSPSSSGFLNALDIFLVVCIVEVFIALSEYALVLFLCLKQTKIRRLKSPNPKQLSVDPPRRTPSNLNTRNTVETNGWTDNILNFKPDNHPNKLDQISLIVFPASFVMFNLVYYCVYIY